MTKGFIQLDACSLASSSRIDVDGNPVYVLRRTNEEGEEVLKPICYMYVFLFVPIDPELPSQIICGMLSDKDHLCELFYL